MTKAETACTVPLFTKMISVCIIFNCIIGLSLNKQTNILRSISLHFFLQHCLYVSFVELLQSEFSSLVERLGFDENFVDITSLVEKSVRGNGQHESQVEVKGHTFLADRELGNFTVSEISRIKNVKCWIIKLLCANCNQLVIKRCSVYLYSTAPSN